MPVKKINPKEKTFYIFEISDGNYLILDSEMDVPIYHGTWNLTAGIMKSIKDKMPKATINYYVKEKNGLTYAEQKMVAFQQEALLILNQFPQSEYRDSLSLIVNYVIERKK